MFIIFLYQIKPLKTFCFFYKKPDQIYTLYFYYKLNFPFGEVCFSK